jgi:RHS repeat-associated protein
MGTGRYSGSTGPGCVHIDCSVRRRTAPTLGRPNQYRYTPCGQREAGTTETITNPFQYAGRHYEPHAGIYQMRARWYDPHLGRFLSEDPIGLAGGINPYAYATNNPGSLRDPSGLIPVPGCYRHWCPIDGVTNSGPFWGGPPEGPGRSSLFGATDGDGFTFRVTSEAVNRLMWGNERGLTVDAFMRGLHESPYFKQATCGAQYYGAPILDAASGALLVELGEPTVLKRFRTPGSSPATSLASACGRRG